MMPKLVDVRERKVLLTVYVKPDNKEYLKALSDITGQSMASLVDEMLNEALQPLKEGWDMSRFKEEVVKKMKLIFRVGE